MAAGVAGGALPPISSMIRTRWSYLLRGSPPLNTALAFESVVDELVFIIGPVLVTFLSTTGHTTSGLVTAFALAVVGSLLFAAQVETEPPPSGHHPHRGPSALRTAGLLVLCPVGAALGMVLGSVEVGLVAFADKVDKEALSGVLIASLAVGSMVAGIAWGLRHWSSELRPRLLLTLAALSAGSFVLVFVPTMWLTIVLVFVAGTAVSPSLISAFTLTERLIPPRLLTEGFTWLGTALGLGVAVGVAAAGKLIDRFDANAAFAVAAAAATIATAVVLLGQPVLHEHRAEARRGAGEQGSVAVRTSGHPGLMNSAHELDWPAVATDACPIGLAVSLIGDCWSLLILRELAFGVDRFDAAGARSPSGWDRYRLTAAGEEVLPLLLALGAWGERYRQDGARSPLRMNHEGCGRAVVPKLSCTAGHEVGIYEVQAQLPHTR